MIAPSETANFRLINQQITKSNFNTPKDLVSWMGAIQAQDFNQAKWAIGVRLPNLKENQIESALNRGEIIRTHIMRPTWHFVSSDDIYWMLKLSAPQIKSATKSRHQNLELTESILKKSQDVLIKALEGNLSMTRGELSSQLNRAGINTDAQRLPHILMEAEIDGIICNGPIRNQKQSYTLLEERIPEKIHLNRDEALSLLAEKYFKSHGPATLSDFVWWSGLPVKDARLALETCKSNLLSETIGSEQYWFSGFVTKPKIFPDSAYLLPAFDEYLIAYKNRNAVINDSRRKKAISNYGIFKPVVVVNGQISGLWKQTVKKNTVEIELEHFRPSNKKEEKLIRKAAESYGNFSGKNVAIKTKLNQE